MNLGSFATAAVALFSGVAAAAFDPEGCIQRPENVNASLNYDCTPVTVYWNQDSALYYNVYRTNTANPNDFVNIGPAYQANVVDESAVPGVTYQYNVEGVAECGISDWSEGALGGRVAYGLPTVNWVYASDSQYCGLITVEWDTSSGAPSYDIYRSETPDFSQAFLISSSAYPTVFDYSVGGNVAYYYFVVPYLECVQVQPTTYDVGYANFSLSITSQPQSMTAQGGGSAGFGVGISGFGAFQWFRDGQMLFDDGRYSGTQSSGLSIYPVDSSDAGGYYCEVYGGCGSQTSDTAYLTVDCSVYIDQNPTNMTVTEGNTAGFSINASGASWYQWYRDGQPLYDDGRFSGTQTPYLSISPVDLADAGGYYCDAYGGCGSATSSSATLSVEPRPTCPADFNQDGGVDGSDVDAFFVAWESGDALADMNQDGGVDGSDIDTFFFHWEGGC